MMNAHGCVTPRAAAPVKTRYKKKAYARLYNTLTTRAIAVSQRSGFAGVRCSRQLMTTEISTGWLQFSPARPLYTVGTGPYDMRTNGGHTTFLKFPDTLQPPELTSSCIAYLLNNADPRWLLEKYSQCAALVNPCWTVSTSSQQICMGEIAAGDQIWDCSSHNYSRMLIRTEYYDVIQDSRSTSYLLPTSIAAEPDSIVQYFP